MQITDNIIPLALDATSPNSLNNWLNSQKIVLPRGAAVLIPCAVFVGSPTTNGAQNYVTDLSNILTVNLVVRQGTTASGPVLLEKVLPASALVAGVTYQQWVNNPILAPFTFVLTPTDTNLAAGSVYIGIGATTTNAGNVALGFASTAQVTDIGVFDADPPATPPGAPGISLATAQAAFVSKLVPTAVMTAAYTAAPGNLVSVNATAGNVPITLPAAPADATQVGVKVVAVSGGYGASVICGGADVLDLVGGNTSTMLSLAHESIILQYAAATAIWTIIEHGYSLASLDGRYVMASVATLAYAASITPAAKGFLNTLNVGTLTGPLALAAPSGNPTDGQVLTLRFAQDATGGRVITWDPIYAFPQASPASTLPTTANAQYEITFGFHAPSGKWRARGAAGPF